MAKPLSGKTALVTGSASRSAMSRPRPRPEPVRISPMSAARRWASAHW